MWRPDFEDVARRFRARDCIAECAGPAIWRFRRRDVTPRMHLLVTVGVHGDETAPIEMLARRLDAWAAAADGLALELFAAIGNLDAVATGKRFVGHDMNRMFRVGAADSTWGAEGSRAELLAREVAKVIRGANGAPVVHLDLHTTIRPSRKATFAMLPGDRADVPLLRWLGSAGLHAAVLNPGARSTLSAFTSRLGAKSCTVELGTVASFGANDPRALAAFEEALDTLVLSAERAWPSHGNAHPVIDTFRVTRELIRSSETFELLVPASAPNFEPIALGELVARDGEHEIRATHPGECVLFPNPSVAMGLRAGLLVAPASASTTA